MRQDKYDEKIKEYIDKFGTFYMNSMRYDEEIKQYLNNVFPQLSSNSNATKIYWILNNINDFPKCHTCGCEIKRDVQNIFHGYCQGKSSEIYCSIKCVENSQKIKNMTSDTKLKKYGKRNYVNTELIKQHKMRDHGDEKWNNREQSVKTCQERYGVNHYTNRKLYVKNRRNRNGGKYDSEQTIFKRKMTNNKRYGCDHPLQNKEIQMKRIQTTLKNLGCQYPMQNEDVVRKCRKKYFYDNRYFSSKPEIAYYIWLTDNKIKFEYQPKSKIMQYVDCYGKKHKYHPDFLLVEDNQIVEIKGDNHFDKNTGKMINITDKNKNYIEEAKFQCMIDNGVKILRNAQYKVYLDYIKENYGVHYIEQFRNNGK